MAISHFSLEGKVAIVTGGSRGKPQGVHYPLSQKCPIYADDFQRGLDSATWFFSRAAGKAVKSREPYLVSLPHQRW